MTITFHSIKRVYWNFLSLIRNRRDLTAIARLGKDLDVHNNNKKSWTWRYLDLCYIFLRWGSVSPLYYGQRIHIHGADVRRDFISYSEFRKCRDLRNIADASVGANFVLRDKLLFCNFFESKGLPVVPTLLDAYDVRLGDLLDSVRTQLPTMHFPLTVFLKPTEGLRGQGVFSVSLFAEGEIISPEGLIDRNSILPRHWLVQRELIQHPEVAALHPRSINTFRVITYRQIGGKIDVLLAYLRIGTNNRVVDNASSGGVIVAIDPDTGRLANQGFILQDEFASRIESHPTTGIAFCGKVLPFANQSITLVIAAHQALPEIHSIGWDIALTNGGPVLIEGNDDWGGVSVMWLMPNFRRCFDRLLKGLPPDSSQVQKTLNC